MQNFENLNQPFQIRITFAQNLGKFKSSQKFYTEKVKKIFRLVKIIKSKPLKGYLINKKLNKNLSVYESNCNKINKNIITKQNERKKDGIKRF